MKRTITVYGLTNECGQICYVGITSNPHERFHAHSNGDWEFSVTGLAVLARTRSLQEARQLERQWIEFFGFENLHNGNGGGGGGKYQCDRLIARNIKFTEEQKIFVHKIAAAQGHDNFSRVINNWVDREMGKPAHA